MDIMKKSLQGKKLNMSQVFTDSGEAIPVTWIKTSGFADSELKEGDKVFVSAKSKGKGFQGVVKRHGFHGGPRSHGQKHSEREPGSIGATGPQRVFKGKKMPGRMGGGRVTLKNVVVVRIIPEENLLALKGAVPGPRNCLVDIRV